MNEYALIVDGIFKEIRRLKEIPENIPHKSVIWLPVDREEVNVANTNYTTTVVNTVIEPTRYFVQTVISDLPQDEINALIESKKDSVIDILDTTNVNIMKAFGAILFEVVNDVLVLKGQQTITVQQFKNYLRSKL